jgi:hypothetical protein
METHGAYPYYDIYDPIHLQRVGVRMVRGSELSGMGTEHGE